MHQRTTGICGGYIKTRSWDHENGARIFRTEIVSTNIIALNRPHKEEESDVAATVDIDNMDEDDFFAVTEEDFDKAA